MTPSMLIKVIGAGAGGGLPQWNCNGQNSVDARHGLPTVKPRTQASVAVSADGRQWVLLNASPDIRQQINATPELHPDREGPPRNSPIKAVVLTNGDVDAVAGLLCLRESQPLTVYGSARVLDVLADNSIFEVLNPDLVKRETMALGQAFAVVGPSGPVGLTIEAFTVPGKIPLYLEDEEKGTGGSFGTEEGDTVGLKVTEDASGKHFFFIPGCSGLDEPLRERLNGAPLLFFDGTLYTNDEMIVQGLMQKTGDRIGHMNMSGPKGTLEQMALLNIARKIFIHINNSNPVLRDDSPERATVEGAGWEVSYDGMEVTL
jgi:pyrroloquinoline quinone biosynthesis protein B